MRYTAKIIKSKENPLKSPFLLFSLLVLTIGATFLVAKLGFIAGVALIIGVIGLGVAVFMVVYPEFGFYVSIFSSFFVFMIMRLFNTELPLVTGIDLMVWLTFVGLSINKGIKRESLWKNCQSPIMFMYLVFLIYYFLEYFNPNGGNSTLYFLFLRRTVTLVLFLYCAIQLFTDMQAINRFFKACIFLFFISALYACYEEWVGMPKFEMNYILSDPLREKLAALDGGGNYRKSSFLASCTDFGLLMAGASILFLVFYQKMKTTSRRKWFILVSLVFCVLAMTYSGTRTATLMLTIEIALYVLMTITERKTMIFFSFFTVLLLAVIFGPSYGNGTLRRLKSTFDLKSEESLQVRDINRHGIQPYIYAHPIGGGVGTTGVAFMEYNTGHPLAGFPTDSGLLAIVLEYGWVGLLMQCLTYFVILQQGVVTYYGSPDKHVKILLLSSILFIFGFVFAQYAQVAIGQIPNGFIFLGLNAVIIRLRQMHLNQSYS